MGFIPKKRLFKEKLSLTYFSSINMNKRNIIVSYIKERFKYVSQLINSFDYTEDIFKDKIFLHIPTERNTGKALY